LDLLKTPEYPKAINNISMLVRNLDAVRDKLDARSVLLKVFFDAKAGEMSEIFKNNPDKSILLLLRKIDAPHSSKYEEGMK
jgi:hypothetical protein